MPENPLCVSTASQSVGSENPVNPSELKPSMIGSVFFSLLPVRRRTVMENLHQVFGDRLSAAEQRRLARCFYGHVAKTIKENLWMMLSSERRIASRVDVVGVEHVLSAAELGRGVLILTGFLIGISRSPELGWRLVMIWVVINGGLAALGALLARGHPLTVLSALVAAPITSLNPTIAAGMVTGLVESWLRKPRVSDLENLRFDITTIKGWFRNPATRILLVFFLSNLGSAIGTWVAGLRIFSELA